MTKIVTPETERLRLLEEALKDVKELRAELEATLVDLRTFGKALEALIGGADAP